MKTIKKVLVGLGVSAGLCMTASGALAARYCDAFGCHHVHPRRHLKHRMIRRLNRRSNRVAANSERRAFNNFISGRPGRAMHILNKMDRKLHRIHREKRAVRRDL